jgi:hypothetical protein
MGNTCDNMLIYKFMNGTDADIYTPQLNRYSWYWDDLIRVVEKIELMNYRVTITFCNCFIDTYDENGDENDEQIALSNSDTKFNAVYEAVIQFINYYNDINKNNLKTK